MDQQAEFDDGTGLHSADNPEKIFYDYLVKTYELYISEGAELESMDYELMANFGEFLSSQLIDSSPPHS